MHTAAAQREVRKNERSLEPGYGCVPRTDGFSRYGSTVLLSEAQFWYR